MGLCPKPRTPAFLSEKSGAKELNFSCFTLSFRAGIYGTKTDMVSRKMKLVFFTCLSASIAAALRRPRVLQAVTPPLSACVYAAQTDTDSRKIKFVFFI